MRTPKSILLLIVLLLATRLLGAEPASAPSDAAASPDLSSLKTAGPEQIKAYFASDQYKQLNRSDEEFLNDAYQAILRRAPDDTGKAAWLKAINNAKDKAKARAKMVATFLSSDEYKGMQAKSSAAPAAPAAPKVEGPDTTRLPANKLFDQTGVFVNDASAFPAKLYKSRLKTGHVAWVALQIDNGGKTRNDNAARINQGWAKEWRGAGFKVGFWGCPRGVLKHNDQKALEQSIPLVQTDAKLAVSLCKKYNADFYLADLEDFFQGYGPTDPTPALNKVYVDAFDSAAKDAGLSKMARALSSEGRIALDFKPWIDAGWDAMPQAYWNAYAVYQPSKCVDFYASVGFPIARIHPTIGTFTSEGEKRTVTLAEYDQDLRSRPTKGFSFYLPESYLKDNDAEYRELAKMSR